MSSLICRMCSVLALHYHEWRTSFVTLSFCSCPEVLTIYLLSERAKPNPLPLFHLFICATLPAYQHLKSSYLFPNVQVEFLPLKRMKSKYRLPRHLSILLSRMHYCKQAPGNVTSLTKIRSLLIQNEKTLPKHRDCSNNWQKVEYLCTEIPV